MKTPVDEHYRFACAKCGKKHFVWTGRTCPCGEPFPQDVREEVYR